MSRTLSGGRMRSFVAHHAVLEAMEQESRARGHQEFACAVELWDRATDRTLMIYGERHQ